MDTKKIKSKIKELGLKIWEKIKNFNIQDCRVSFENGMKGLEANGKYLYVLIGSAVVLMGLVCLLVFFVTVQGHEKVLVPQVEGKELPQALIEMQIKELYPKVQLKHDQQPAGTILNQSPDAGAIVKAGARVTLTVSLGNLVKEVGNYIGQNYDAVKIDLATMVTGDRRGSVIQLADPVYKADLSEAGTILEQFPAPGTKIDGNVKVQLVVSRGPSFDKTRVPRIIGKNIQEVLGIMASSKIVFDFTASILPDSRNKDVDAVVLNQETFDTEFVPNYQRVSVELGLPVKSPDDNVYGIFQTKLNEYPYPVAMTVECIEKNGQRYQIVALNHTGGNFTVPYAVPAGSELILRVSGKEMKRINVNK